LIAGAAALALGGGCRKREARPAAQAGAFFRCLTASEIDVGGIANGQQVRRLVESAFEREGEAFVERVEGRCAPMIAGMEKVVREYAGRMRGWRVEDEDEDEDEDGDGDGAIVRGARGWSAGYERFLGCVVPELEKVRDGQALYERLANACFQGDLAGFVGRVRESCVPLLTKKPQGEARLARLRDPEGRHEGLWKQCLELAEEQRRMRDGEALVAAVDAFLAARPRD
jgi:hypothetical protein